MKNAYRLKIIPEAYQQHPTFRLGKKFTKVVLSNGENTNHSLMGHLMVCCSRDLNSNYGV
jgi:hypothetical protein